MGLLILSEASPDRPSPGLPGAEQLEEKHTDAASATSVPWCRMERKPQGDSWLTTRRQTSPPPPGQTSTIWTPLLEGGVANPWASTPARAGCLQPNLSVLTLLRKSSLPSAQSRICCISLNRGARNLVVYVGNVVYVGCLSTLTHNSLDSK